MSAAIIIPARFASTRLPGKMLLSETGKPLLQHSWEQAMKVRNAARVLIATDDQRIADAAKAFGGQAVMTASHHATGSNRIAEAAATISDSIIVNLQGDEPDIDPAQVEKLIDHQAKSTAAASTLACSFPPGAKTGSGSPADPNCVKVALTPLSGSEAYRALYFSRAPIPGGNSSTAPNFLHIGVYAYSRDSLIDFANADRTDLEKAENLEQLRILERGGSIDVLLTQNANPGIDTRADYDAFVARIKSSGL